MKVLGLVVRKAESRSSDRKVRISDQAVYMFMSDKRNHHTAPAESNGELLVTFSLRLSLIVFSNSSSATGRHPIQVEKLCAHETWKQSLVNQA